LLSNKNDIKDQDPGIWFWYVWIYRWSLSLL